jgi:hypothetical protein
VGNALSAVDVHRQEVINQGFTMLESVIPTDEVGQVCEQVTAAAVGHDIANVPAGRGAVSGLINQTQCFVPYLVEPRLLGLTQALLGEHVRVSYTSTIVALPGATKLKWHADWPFNQHNAGHLDAPYPDAVMHLTSIWMLTDFTHGNGATFIVPGSHREPNNPTGGYGMGEFDDHPDAKQMTGKAGSVMVMDSRMWHAAPANTSEEARIGLAIRWAPWWLNLDVLMAGSDERRRMVDEPGRKDNQVPAVDRAVFEGLDAPVQTLFRHWVRD